MPSSSRHQNSLLPLLYKVDSYRIRLVRYFSTPRQGVVVTSSRNVYCTHRNPVHLRNQVGTFRHQDMQDLKYQYPLQVTMIRIIYLVDTPQTASSYLNLLKHPKHTLYPIGLRASLLSKFDPQHTKSQECRTHPLYDLMLH